MMIRYYVLPAGSQFQVRREGVCKGLHSIEARAVQAAKFMAAVEASKLGLATEVFIELDAGRFTRLDSYFPHDPVDLDLPSGPTCERSAA